MADLSKSDIDAVSEAMFWACFNAGVSPETFAKWNRAWREANASAKEA